MMMMMMKKWELVRDECCCHCCGGDQCVEEGEGDDGDGAGGLLRKVTKRHTLAVCVNVCLCVCFEIFELKPVRGA